MANIGGGWKCSRCTFHHHAAGSRCAMCNELRTTRQQMHDFVLGVPIPDDSIGTAKANANTADNDNDNVNVNVNEIQTTTTTATKGNATMSTNKSAATSTTAAASSFKAAAKSAVMPIQKKAHTVVQKAPAAVSMRNPYSKQQRQQPPQQKQQAPPPSSNTAQAAPSPLQQQQQQQQQWPESRQYASAGTSASASAAPVPAQQQMPQHQQQQQQQQPPRANQPARSRANVNTSSTTATTTKATPAASNSNPFAMAASAATDKKMNVARRPVYSPGPVPLDPATADTWIYPSDENFPKRGYQVEISESALFHNTLVSLPTGLGKTLIAAVVLYNYYRWFPTGKVLFLAPTLPLVNQQVKACYDVAGIPAADTAVLTGKIPSVKRQVIWNDRRVFFCTPQTVQKDLDAAKCPADRIVCVVLDEAHKASGEYAYVKVVEQLEAAGAKFRILGLSATPGTNLKAIQQVSDALRINKIEARQDSDPSVAQYIHARSSEIVVVALTSASKTIEHSLNNLIGPILDRLRSAGALTRITGNATVTAYNIIRAREDFAKRGDGGDNNNPNNSMMGWFSAAQTFVQIRSDLHKHGVGMVRGKMMRLRTDRQRGMVASIVKGKEFGLLWEEVAKATCDPNSSQAGVQDKLINNPKLSKLRDILIEHFERARACSKSSRAIVFSQFRDSVSEIVSLLGASEPLIRPRHFVGQGKGAKVEGGTATVKGMKQAEQHQVIREFREDVYNVLVCTCIGEEGLDIGEVDLIVNFDTLRSPIRMIQRVGRTGRKRNGRVVCLVAEGPEEKTLVASKQAERNLNNALRNPKSFKVAPTIPMFLNKPTLCERDMVISKNFRMSQLGGHENAKKKVARTSTGSLSKSSAQSRVKWRLSEEEERKRAVVLGAVENIPSLNSSQFPVALLRRLFAAKRARSTCASKSKKKVSTGRTTGLLKRFEELYADVETAEPVGNAPRTRSTRCEDSALEVLFPLTADHTAEKTFAKKASLSCSIASRKDDMIAIQAVSSIAGKPVTKPFPPVGEPETVLTGASKAKVVQAKPPVASSQSKIALNPYSRPPKASKAPPQVQNEAFRPDTREEPSKASKAAPQVQNEAFRPDTREEPSKVSKSAPQVQNEAFWPDTREEPSKVSKAAPQVQNKACRPAAIEEPSNASKAAFQVQNEACRPDAKEEESSSLPTKEVPGAISERHFECGVASDVSASRSSELGLPETEDFRLPTQDDSSSSSEEDDGNEDEETFDGARRVEVVAPTNVHAPTSVIGISCKANDESPNNDEDSFRLPTQESDSDDDSNGEAGEVHCVGGRHAEVPIPGPITEYAQTSFVKAQNNADDEVAYNNDEDSFRLPTQDSSSSEDESISDGAGDIDYDDDVPLISLQKSKAKRVWESQQDEPLLSLKTVQEDVPLISLLKSKSSQLSYSLNVPLISLRKKQESQSEELAGDEKPQAVACISTNAEAQMLPQEVSIPNNSAVAARHLSLAASNPLFQSESPDIPLPLKRKAQRRAVFEEDEDTPAKYIPLSSKTFTASATVDLLVDTPPDGRVSFPYEKASADPLADTPLDRGDSLADTPLEKCRLSGGPEECIDDIVCAVCLSGESHDEDPIILCDGQDENRPCDLAVHSTCYGAAVNLDTDEPWRCDPCEFRFSGGQGVLQCIVCRGGKVPLKRISLNNGWKHPDCNSAANDNQAKRHRLRKVQQGGKVVKTAGRDSRPRTATLPEPSTASSPKRKRQRYRYHNFLDEEAGIDSGEDVDGDDAEEDDLAAIEEEEEFARGFINDSSQLGYTQDELERVDPEACHDDSNHRAVDAERERKRQFATPVLNRRMKANTNKSEWSATQSSTAGSEKGLGNMHFIRSVLEHHRQGGQAEDIENVYHELEEEEDSVDETNMVPARKQPQRTIMHYESSGDDEDED